MGLGKRKLQFAPKGYERRWDFEDDRSFMEKHSQKLKTIFWLSLFILGAALFGVSCFMDEAVQAKAYGSRPISRRFLR